jgi:hypothetical protein
MYWCIHLSFRSSFHIWRKTCNLCPSATGLLCLTRSLCIYSNNVISFFFMVEWYFIVHIYHIFLTHSSVVRHLSYFQSLGIVNSAAIYMGVQVSLLYPGLHSFRYMPRNGITGSYSRSVSSFLKNHHTFFHSDCTYLHSHW